MKTKFVQIENGRSLKQVKVIAAELRRIQTEQSVITPASVVETARDESSPLHGCFEWDNRKAADNYRLWQARMLIRSVYIVDSSDKNAQPVRAFVNVIPEEDSDEFITDRGYVFTPTIATKANYQNQVLSYAMQQLKGWRARFGNYRQFFGVVREIDKIA